MPRKIVVPNKISTASSPSPSEERAGRERSRGVRAAPKEPKKKHGGDDARIAIITPLPEELQTLRSRARRTRRLRLAGPGRYWRAELAGRLVILGWTGDGRRAARESLASLLQAREIETLVIAGVAGALTPDLEVGDVVLAKTVRDADGPLAPSPPKGARGSEPEMIEGLLFTHDRILANASAKLALGRELGAPTAAVDLETTVYARVATAHGIPFVALRAISDTAGEDLALDFQRFADADGHTRRGAVIWHALTHPWIIPDLRRLQRRMRLCSERLATAILSILHSNAD